MGQEKKASTMEPTIGISVKMRKPVPLGARKPSGAQDLRRLPTRWAAVASVPRSAADGGAMTDMGVLRSQTFNHEAISPAVASGRGDRSGRPWSHRTDLVRPHATSSTGGQAEPWRGLPPAGLLLDQLEEVRRALLSVQRGNAVLLEQL